MFQYVASVGDDVVVSDVFGSTVFAEADVPGDDSASRLRALCKRPPLTKARLDGEIEPRVARLRDRLRATCRDAGK